MRIIFIFNGQMRKYSYPVGEHWPEMMRFETRPALITTPILMGHLFTADQHSPRAFTTPSFHCETPRLARNWGTQVDGH